MSYLPFAILGYLFNGASVLIDKALVDKGIKNPKLLTFYITVLGFLTLLLIPLGFQMPNLKALSLGFSAGGCFFVGMLLFLSLLARDEASGLTPISGTLNSIFTFLIGLIIFSQHLNPQQILSFIVLIIGLVFLTFKSWLNHHISKKFLLQLLVASIFTASSAVLTREVFIETNFITGLILINCAMAISSLFLLFSRPVRMGVLQFHHHHLNQPNSSGPLLFLGRILGALAGLFISYSISLANPALVNSLQGVQYILMLVIVLLLPHRFQDLLEEHTKREFLIPKVIGCLFIALGLAILTLA